MNKLIPCALCLFFAAFCCWVILALTGSKKHDFEGKCLLCHLNLPGNDSNPQDLILVDSIDKTCDGCHKLNKDKSHPINVKPRSDIPLKTHLDKNGLLTCTSCHDVHKEDKTSNELELAGLLWGHLKGRAFCALCHNKETLGTGWQHQTAIPYAHSYGKLTQISGGGRLDKFSIECLSCHDGTISRFPQIEVTQGAWLHGSGDSHPVGAEYPRSEDFKPVESLPSEIQLFDGKIGCLSCHEIYGKETNMLAMTNIRSRLCLSCHKK